MAKGTTLTNKPLEFPMQAKIYAERGQPTRIELHMLDGRSPDPGGKGEITLSINDREIIAALPSEGFTVTITPGVKTK